MSEFKRVLSPLLHVAAFVGTQRDGKPAPHAEDGNPWLWAHEHGFSFCVAEIDRLFQPLPLGECVRIEAGVLPFDGAVKFKVRDAVRISGLADQMLLTVFGAADFEVLASVIEDEFYERFCVTIPDFQDGYPDEVAIYYRVVRV